jgi:Flp pilus assembly protein TadD
VALRPDHAPVHYNLATVLKARGDLTGAIAAYRRAIALDSNFAWAHNNLGQALLARRDVPGAIAAYRAAIRADPRLATAHYNLGNVLLESRNDAKGAIAAFRQAIALDPGDADAHYNLGNALRRQGNLPAAAAAYRQAIALNRQHADAHYNLGNTLLALNDAPSAVAAFQQAVAARPRFAQGHCNLGLALRLVGDLQGSLAAYRTGHELGMQQPGWRSRYPSGKWVKQAERLAELDRQLPDFLAGKRRPPRADVCLELAAVCDFKKQFAAGVHFYQAAFRADSKAEGANRTSAACTAALAGCGQGLDATGLSADEKARLRRQALAWLRADLAQRQSSLREGRAADRNRVRGELAYWLRTTDLAGVRDEKPLAGLPAEERHRWRQFWHEVRRLAK